MNLDIYLGLGTNLGNQEKNLIDVLRLIKANISGANIKAVSDIFLTSPIGGIPQPDYLNCAIILSETINDSEGGESLSGAVLKLFSVFKEIEKALGRDTEIPRNSPRIIDIDILYIFDCLNKKPVALDIPGLKIPHPGIHNRKFVLIPLLDLIGKVPFIENKIPFNEIELKKSLVELGESESGMSQKVSLYGRFNDDFTLISR